MRQDGVILGRATGAGYGPRVHRVRPWGTARSRWAVVAAVLSLGLLLARDQAAGPRHVRMGKATVIVGGRATGVPSSFLGFSTEYWTVPTWRRRLPLVRRALAAIHVRGDGPLVLRVGGDSSDQALFRPRARDTPEWVVELSRGWLRDAGVLVHRAGVRLILDLNLLTATSQIGTTWARGAVRQLPHGSIAGFEIGNEPDIYHRRYRLRLIKEKSLADGLLPGEPAAAQYARDFVSYARRVSAVAPGIPILGPALADPSRHVRWVSRLLAAPGPGPGAVSAHQYPYSACEHPGSRGYPTIARVLGDRAAAGLVGQVRPALRMAHRAGVPFRLTEINSVTCGGRRGVSDTFATALWAPDALFELLRAGVDSVNVHIRAPRINEAFSLTGKGLVARPLLYGLIAFSRTLGPGAKLVRVRLEAPHSLQLKAWAVRVRGNTLRVLLIDKGARPVRAVLRLPATGRASVQRLRAPSVGSRFGVTFDGRRLGLDGRWHGARDRETVVPGRRGYAVTIPRRSAALVSVHVARR